MRKTLTAFIAAAMAVTAVSCGSRKEDKYEVSKSTVASAEVGEDNTEEAAEIETEEETEDELTKRLRERLEENIERCVDIRLQELPKYDIPNDWKEINNGTVKMLVPPEVSETEKTDSSLVENEYQNEDDSVHIIFHHWNEWEDGWVGHPAFPELTGEDVKAAFSELGVDYDGSRASFLKAVTSFTSDDKTAENEEAFRTASIEKGIELNYYGSVFHNLSDGHDVYMKGDYSEYMAEDEMSYAYVLIFSDSNKEYSVRVEAPTKEEILMMCSTLSFS